MRSLLCIIILVVGFSLSLLLTYPFWPAEFLLKDQLLTLWRFLSVIYCLSLVAFHFFLFCWFDLYVVQFVWSTYSMCFSLALSYMRLSLLLRLDWLSAIDVGSIPGSGRFHRGGDSNPLRYSCLENPMDGGACRTMVHRVTKSWRQL